MRRTAGALVGVPEMMRCICRRCWCLIVSPGGKAPPEPLSQVPLVSTTHQLYGATPPVTDSMAVIS